MLQTTELRPSKIENCARHKSCLCSEPLRWFSTEDVEVPVAKFLDVILYSREQLVKEYNDMPAGKGSSEALPDAPWGIIRCVVRAVHSRASHSYLLKHSSLQCQGTRRGF